MGKISLALPGLDSVPLGGYAYNQNMTRLAHVTFHAQVNDAGTAVDLTDAANIISADMTDLSLTTDQPVAGYLMLGAYAEVSWEMQLADGAAFGVSGVEPMKRSLWASRLYMSHKPVGLPAPRNEHIRHLIAPQPLTNSALTSIENADGEVRWLNIQQEMGGLYRPFAMGPYPIRFDEDVFQLRWDRASQQDVNGDAATLQIHTIGILVPGKKDGSWPRIPSSCAVDNAQYMNPYMAWVKAF